MKLLFDANLSRHLVHHLDDLFAGSAHVSDLGAAPDDIEIWRYAAALGYVIVSKDSDFYRMSMVWGAPPKVVWLRHGNAGSQVVIATLRRHVQDLLAFDVDANAALLSLGVQSSER